MKIIAIIFSFICLLLSGCGGVLYSNLEEKEANEMLALLTSCGIDANVALIKDKASITVPPNQKASAVNALYAYGYPRNNFDTVPILFPSDSLIKSPLEEQARYNYAIGQEIASMLSIIDGIIEVKVHIVMPFKDASRETYGSKQRGANDLSVSVMIKHSKLVNLKEKISDITTLVSKSIPKISPSNVGIILFESETPAMQGLAYKEFAVGIIQEGYPYLPIVIGIIVFILIFVGIVLFFYLSSRKTKADTAEKDEEATGEEEGEAEA